MENKVATYKKIEEAFKTLGLCHTRRTRMKEYIIDKKARTFIKAYCKAMNMNKYGLYKTIVKIEEKNKRHGENI